MSPASYRTAPPRVGEHHVTGSTRAPPNRGDYTSTTQCVPPPVPRLPPRVPSAVGGGPVRLVFQCLVAPDGRRGALARRRSSWGLARSLNGETCPGGPGARLRW